MLAMPFRGLAMPKINRGMILKRTGLLKRVKTKSFLAVRDGKMGDHWSVQSSTLMTAAIGEVQKKTGE